MIITIRMLLGDEGGMGTALEQFVKRGSRGVAVRGWASRPSGPSARSVLSAQAVASAPVPSAPVPSAPPTPAAEASPVSSAGATDNPR
jgi:hypothetical protein